MASAGLSCSLQFVSLPCKCKMNRQIGHSAYIHFRHIHSRARPTIRKNLSLRSLSRDIFSGEKNFGKVLPYRRQPTDQINASTTAHRSRSNCGGEILTRARYVSSPSRLAVSLRSALFVSLVLFSVGTFVVYLVSASRCTAISRGAGRQRTNYVISIGVRV